MEHKFDYAGFQLSYAVYAASKNTETYKHSIVLTNDKEVYEYVVQLLDSWKEQTNIKDYQITPSDDDTIITVTIQVEK